jgi:hypothetical protein
VRVWLSVRPSVFPGTHAGEIDERALSVTAGVLGERSFWILDWTGSGSPQYPYRHGDLPRKYQLNAPHIGRSTSRPKWIATPFPWWSPAGIAQVDIARCRGISTVTLRKHYERNSRPA